MSIQAQQNTTTVPLNVSYQAIRPLSTDEHVPLPLRLGMRLPLMSGTLPVPIATTMQTTFSPTISPQCCLQAIKASAQFNLILGNCFENGTSGCPKSPVLAFNHYMCAADTGDAEGQFYVADCYVEGIGVPKSMENAVTYFRKGAAQGHLGCLFNLGVCLEKGDGTPQNLVDAARCYRLAALGGHAKAQYNWAICLDRGKGVAQNLEEAINFFKMAATGGVLQARQSLKQRKIL